MPRLDTHGYLERLGIADPGEPSVAGLRSALWTRVRAAHDAWLARTASALATSA